MKYYFRTRYTLVLLAVALGLELMFLLMDRPLAIHHESGVIAFTPAVPLQILVVGTLSFGLSSRMEQFEFAGMRQLFLLRLVNGGALAVAGIAVSSLISIAADASTAQIVTVGLFAPTRAFIGLFGLTLAMIAFTDMRLGALCALPFVFLPAAFDTRSIPVGSIIGFVLADPEVSSWLVASAFLAIGLILYVTAYSERNSPSPNRRALIDSRSRRKRTSSD